MIVLLADEKKEYIFDRLVIMDNVNLVHPSFATIASIKLFGDVDYLIRNPSIHTSRAQVNLHIIPIWKDNTMKTQSSKTLLCPGNSRQRAI
jgi:hypothetical protein